MLAMYRIIPQDNYAEENVPLGASRGFLRFCIFDMRISKKKLRDVWQYLGFVPVAVVLVVCVASVTFPPRIICTRIKGLSAQQMRFCEKNPAAMESITDGYHLGVDECKYQFRKRRWNCTSLGSKHTFSSHAVPGTKESAFTHAIISAGIAHAVTLACTKGNYSNCGCDLSLKGVRSSDGSWIWGGCSVNINRGIEVADAFLDGQDTSQSDIALMNKHNNRLGGQVMRNNLVRECKCHGTTSFCTVQTCWYRLPPFRALGHRLHEIYSRNTVKVKRADVGTPSLVYKDDKYTKPKHDGTEAVYLIDSPNYCERNLTKGILGTKGRTCIKDISDQRADVCDVMCCGRGYDTRIVNRSWKCNCKFYWCCYVRCKSCSEKAVLHNCK
ncbi:protein Wnt-7a-like isoform X2 [Actinia tenebrosa]|uniref:Protein Wnt n=1 Tax=Actinia tenebrosa TaxID=6105 RepID=A0A6P8IYH7_ACTTE|nr:protein Wnt-7a-like isoform X2 [Actinia tenebrosa]